MAGDYFSRSGRERVAGYHFSCMGGRKGGSVLFFLLGVDYFSRSGRKRVAGDFFLHEKRKGCWG